MKTEKQLLSATFSMTILNVILLICIFIGDEVNMLKNLGFMLLGVILTFILINSAVLIVSFIEKK